MAMYYDVFTVYILYHIYMILEEHSKDRAPHAFVLPFYDTNIGHWMKQHGSMNPLQSYEMQSILQPGDTVIDVRANLGCYTLPFAERVGLLERSLQWSHSDGYVRLWHPMWPSTA